MKNVNLNLEKKVFKDQRWLVAHNAWNTEQSPNNQRWNIADLLDYGVRGLALDIHGSKDNLFLRHAGLLESRTNWEKVRNEIKEWIEENPREIVTLFFESYLDPAALAQLSETLNGIGGFEGWDSSLTPDQVATLAKRQTDAISKRTLTSLIDGGTDTQGNALKPKRLFAFIEKEPDEGPQTLFPLMTDWFAENVYGDASLDEDTWVNGRDGSNPKTNKLLTFMNHFGNAPSGSQWDRNDPDLIVKHADAFMFTFFGHYPNFISLDYIDWSEKNPGPIKAIQKLKSAENHYTTAFSWDEVNSFDEYKFYIKHGEGHEITGFTVDTAKGEGIVKIVPKRGATAGVRAIQVVNVPGYGIVNMRYKTDGDWKDWMTNFEKDTDVDTTNLSTHKVRTDHELIGIACRMADGYGVVDFAIATRPKKKR